MGVVQVYDEQEIAQAAKQRRLRNAVGQALGRAYPAHPWHVTVPWDCSIVQITCPAITQQYGMTLHATNDTLELERKAVRMAGELLERFKVSRTVADFSDVKRNIIGEARGARKGEQ